MIHSELQRISSSKPDVVRLTESLEFECPAISLYL